MILMIDNYDSFTYNLVRYCQDLGLELVVKHSDKIQLDDISRLNPKAILLSPGPGTPNDAGISLQTVKRFSGVIPILGICLGHQVVCQAFGAVIQGASSVIHGKTSKLYHTDTALFYGLGQGFSVARYHSLVAKPSTLPESLQILAWTLNQQLCAEEIMAVKHREHETYGVQFHPEALLTEHGYAILAAFFQAQGIDIDESALQIQEVPNELSSNTST